MPWADVKCQLPALLVKKKKKACMLSNMQPIHNFLIAIFFFSIFCFRLVADLQFGLKNLCDCGDFKNYEVVDFKITKLQTCGGGL